MSSSDTIALVGLTLGVLSFIGGFALWYRGAIEKRYAAERAFGHIKRNQEQLAANLEVLSRDFDDQIHNLQGELKEIKAYSLSLSQRFEVILTRLEAQSGIFGRRPE